MVSWYPSAVQEVLILLHDKLLGFCIHSCLAEKMVACFPATSALVLTMSTFLLKARPKISRVHLERGGKGFSSLMAQNSLLGGVEDNEERSW